MKMQYQNIEQFIAQFPIYQYEVVDSSEIEFNDKIKAACKKDCSSYGTSWGCQPAIGRIDKCKEKCLRFSKALIFSSIAEVSDDNPEKLLKAKKNHEQITKQIAKFLKVNDVPMLVLSTGACSLCEKCTYPKRTCMRVESMIPCIESHGIDLLDTLEKYQMDYYLEDDMKIWFGIIFLEED